MADIPSPVWVNLATTDKIDDELTKLTQDLKKQVDGFYEPIVEILSLASQALDFAASFISEFANPIKLLLDGVIQTIRAIISDMRNVGVYLTYSDSLKKNPSSIEPFKGNGWVSAEAEIIQKLSDSQDSTRPVASPLTSVITLTAFGGVGADDIETLLKIIKSMMRFIRLLSAKGVSLYRPPLITEIAEVKNNFVDGVAEELPAGIISTRFLPDASKIKWKVNKPSSPATKADLLNSIGVAAPTYLITVSSRAIPLPIVISDERGGYLPIKDREGKFLDTRMAHRIRPDERLLVLNENNKTAPLSNFTSETKIFQVRPNVIRVGGRDIKNKTGVSFFSEGEYSLIVEYEDLPQKTWDFDKEQEVNSDNSYSVSISAHDTDIFLGDDITWSEINYKKAPDVYFELAQNTTMINEASPKFSEIKIFNRVDNETASFFSALRDSLSLFFIYPEKTDGLDVATYNRIKSLLDIDKDSISEPDPSVFSARLGYAVEKLLVRNKISSKALLKSLKKDVDAINSHPLSEYGYSYMTTEEDAFQAKLGWAGLFFYIDDTLIRRGEVNEYFDERGAYTSHRDKILSAVFQKRVSRGEGAWLSYRFFEDGIPYLETFFEAILASATVLSKAFDGAVANILALIEGIQKRIEFIQQFLAQIKEAIDFILNFRLPSDLSYLITSSAGTEGFISDLSSAQNKPISEPNTYGVYSSFVFVGLPTILTNFLISKMGGQDHLNKWLTGYDEEGNAIVGIGNVDRS